MLLLIIILPDFGGGVVYTVDLLWSVLIGVFLVFGKLVVVFGEVFDGLSGEREGFVDNLPLPAEEQCAKVPSETSQESYQRT